MKKRFFLLLVAALSLAAETKPATAAPELNPTEVSQLERFADLFDEYAQQMAEIQVRIKVIQEMQQKLTADLNNFTAAAIAARGFKLGEATLDLQQRKIVPVAAKTEKPAAPAK